METIDIIGVTFLIITGLVIVIPLTSSLETLKFPHTLRVDSSRENGLEKDSIALTFQIRAIDKRRFKHKIGNLENNYLKEMDKMLRNLLKLVSP